MCARLRLSSILLLGCGVACSSQDELPNDAETNRPATHESADDQSAVPDDEEPDETMGMESDDACDPFELGAAEFLDCQTDCEPRDESVEDDAICFWRFNGKMIDASGEPFTTGSVSVCGELCFSDLPQGDGEFTIPLFHWLVTEDYSVGTHGGVHYSSFYYTIDPSYAGAAALDLGALRVFDLPSDGELLVTSSQLEGEDLSPAQTVSSGPVSLSVPEGTELRLEIGLVFEGDEGRRFRAVEIPAEHHGEYAPEFDETARLIAMGPFDSEFVSQLDEEEGANVSVSIANTGELAPGQAVDVYALGSFYFPDWIPPNRFSKIGTATVSEDGERIELPGAAAGAGFQAITWLALVPHNIE